MAFGVAIENVFSPQRLSVDTHHGVRPTHSTLAVTFLSMPCSFANGAQR
jgi:hypothetical protein